MRCDCGQNKTFETCCGLYLSGQANAPSALDLMRSRYCAYVRNDMDYIQKTMTHQLGIAHSSTQFVRLEIIASSVTQVEFKAYYIENQRLHVLHELSDFILKNNQWLYTHGQLFPTSSTMIVLNKPCPCGSGRKYKNCHYR